MCVEGLGGGTAAHRVERRRLHFEEPALVEEVAQRGDDGAACPKHLRHLRVGEEIDVPLSVALLHVFEPMPFGGRRKHRFTEVPVASGTHR